MAPPAPPAPSISLEKIEQAQPTPFSVSRKNNDLYSAQRPVRKPVNVEELKNVLGQALDKIHDQNDKKL